MGNSFITNQAQKTLSDRINTLISVSEELKFLVGFFYFSGWHQLKSSIKNNSHLTIKILVGLEVEKFLAKTIITATNKADLPQIIEVANHAKLSQDAIFENFLSSLNKSINHYHADTQEAYQDFAFLVDLIKNNKIIIRKTKQANHAKLYLFTLNAEQKRIQGNQGTFITGSSNLTKQGLVSQAEFNVEIKDYGFADASTYFDDLWQDAMPITENKNYKQRMIDYITTETLLAQITPFEAYALVLKTFVEVQQQKKLLAETKTDTLLKDAGFIKYKFQIDAVNQALNMLDNYNGCLIADVVGLGKSIIACLIAANLNLRGVIICPPGLMNNWESYKNQFKLYNWEVYSRGKIKELSQEIHEQHMEVVIVDEAHSFRNDATDSYEYLSIICNNRKVILLTATPFNNSPQDIFALLKLFIIPGKSAITLDNNLVLKFKTFTKIYDNIGYINKNYSSEDPVKAKKAQELYKEMVEDGQYDQAKRDDSLTNVSKQIKSIISPLVIRRNRLDLLQDVDYQQEISSFSEIADPIPIYFELSDEQDSFYDKVISDFGTSQRFTGAIYQPFKYTDSEKENTPQKNLFDFMRRILIKRFESSFGAFAKTIGNFINMHQTVLNFIQKHNQYVLNRDLIKKCEAQDLDENEVNDLLQQYENDEIFTKSKNTTVYKIEDLGDVFVSDIKQDIQLFQSIKESLNKLKLLDNDPKVAKIIKTIAESLQREPDRKIIVFSEYIDTVNHIQQFFERNFPTQILVCTGDLPAKLKKTLEQEFNAGYHKQKQTNQYKILLTTDVLAEGFNLNRAGIVINYDIPWNPTKVIQRVGRINRIGDQVFEALYIYNNFPTKKGADHVQVEEIAKHKMFIIHQALGEDAKIFDEFEQPSAANLFTKMNQNPDNIEEEASSMTTIRNRLRNIRAQYPQLIERIEKLSNRVKTAKATKNKYQLNILYKKGLALFCQVVDEENNMLEIPIEEFLDHIECNFAEPRLELSDRFWVLYEQHKQANHMSAIPVNDRHSTAENKAIRSLKNYLNDDSISPEHKQFAQSLIEDIKYYYTLSANTIKKLGKNTGANYAEYIEKLGRELGIDYLEKKKKQISHIQQDIIICVENIENENIE